jgi:hypothetical protein
MQVPNHIVCDVCERSKGETNHWLVAITHSDYAGVVFVPAVDVTEPRNPEGQYEDICGHACAVKRFSQWLETIK